MKLNGMARVLLVVTRANFDDQVIGPDGRATAVSPFVTATILKPSEASVLGVELSASYAYASYQSDALRYSRLDLDENGVSAGGTIYLRLESSPTLGPEVSSVDGHNSYRFKIGLVVPNRRR